jgi:predicted DNA binding CopG/RHH family protein
VLIKFVLSYEKEIEEAIEVDEFKSVKNLEKEIAVAREMAESHSRKDQRMNIRISQRDLERIKSKAMEEGVPYQPYSYLSSNFFILESMAPLVRPKCFDNSFT